MNVPRNRAIGATGVLAAAALTLSACGSTPAASTTANDKNASTATSAADLGGMDALVAAAKKEGTLNVIALPRDWANYGAIIDGFSKKYGIKVQDDNPTGSSQDEITAVTSRKGQSNAPDVLDLGSQFALSGTQQGLFAPYKVANFDQIPAAQKDSNADWYNDYGGYISIGCDAKRVKECPKTFADLVKPEYRGQVSLNGDPTKSGAAFGAVYAASMANGGSFVQIQPGLDFFAKLKRLGNYNPAFATPASIVKGQTPITIDWDYLNVAYADTFKNKGVNWQVNVPTDGVYAQYYSQAINANAPHPAAARLWEEYLYSNDGQNLFLKGYARPAMMDAMEVNGSLDPVAAGKLPAVSGSPAFPTEDQLTTAKQTVAQKWAQTIS
ncbi:ABC transporter substrate-binding protein [Streptantibioticus rubrisoli]|uniref:ABC transporter substrate-binding protein n=1 Tax=Streptantibioticus rubrisoli TaxID=1387313 RepID=A0ABT1P804_9ACTN|nr:ABC transporter substrate-binding protein [Streptantibioticus rubrisoli]MCQ4041512.1 ABC transporter substrate-binding protein [Streptantibioticus rubrisoli]